MDVLFIKSLFDAVPFTPFLVATTRTGTYTVTSPASALLTTTAIYLARNPDASGIPTDVSIIPLVQITAIKLVEGK